jgi:NAD(P)-dependent dehydrogenase (short-subunit alcohol dehydrogenase family)
MRPLAVVTGGSGGVGGAVIAELQERGWDTVSLSRRDGCDVSDERHVASAFAKLPRLDALVNAAAVLTVRPFVDMTAQDWDEQLDAGLRAPFLCSREAFRRMAPGGTIVMVSSLSGVTGAEKFPGMAAYVAAKSGLAGLTEVLAVEGRSLGIRVNAVSPGAVDTPMVQRAGIGGPRLRPREVAGVIAWLCSPESTPLSGANLRLDPS